MPLEQLRQINSVAHLIEDANIDTDVVYPARFLLVIDRDGIGQHAFHDWRKTRDGMENPEFPAPSLMSRDRMILVAGPNFGCGSSREHAVWTLADLGLRCIIAPSFGEIFYSNCFKNGLLPIALEDHQQWTTIRNAAAEGVSISVDLEALQIRVDGSEAISFEVPSFRRNALLNGWDEIDMVLEQDSGDIRAFESQRRAEAPWLFRPLEDDNKAHKDTNI
ncbi:MAG: 3-isopropylmalate/(R)-2-methylmalate dehydratase small subunit [Halieaceae bacterium]|jgi:3-isopropylmalate/(R)-2-methylmalate dehydratase small subunit